MAKLNIDIEDAHDGNRFMFNDAHGKDSVLPERCEKCGGLTRQVRMQGDFAYCRCFRMRRKK